MAAITIQNLTKRFPLGWREGQLVALRDLDLEVLEGEIYGLLGPNGSGKSTTMKLILGLLRPSAGRIEVFGQAGESLPARREVGFMPESPDFYPYLTGRETLEFYAALCGVPKQVVRRRIDELLDLVGLAHAQHRRLAGYSKGMRQRIGLAQALVHQPRLILLDEPTAGVDPIGSHEIRRMIKRLKELGKTVLLSSHLLEQVQEVCDRICILHRGEKILEGRVSELVADQSALAITVRRLSADGRAAVTETIRRQGAELVAMEHPRSTLESLFIEAVRREERAGGDPAPRAVQGGG